MAAQNPSNNDQEQFTAMTFNLGRGSQNITEENTTENRYKALKEVVRLGNYPSVICLQEVSAHARENFKQDLFFKQEYEVENDKDTKVSVMWRGNMFKRLETLRGNEVDIPCPQVDRSIAVVLKNVHNDHKFLVVSNHGRSKSQNLDANLLEFSELKKLRSPINAKELAEAQKMITHIQEKVSHLPTFKENLDLDDFDLIKSNNTSMEKNLQKMEKISRTIQSDPSPKHKRQHELFQQQLEHTRKTFLFLLLASDSILSALKTRIEYIKENFKAIELNALMNFCQTVSNKKNVKHILVGGDFNLDPEKYLPPLEGHNYFQHFTWCNYEMSMRRGKSGRKMYVDHFFYLKKPQIVKDVWPMDLVPFKGQGPEGRVGDTCQYSVRAETQALIELCDHDAVFAKIEISQGGVDQITEGMQCLNVVGKARPSTC